MNLTLCVVMLTGEVASRRGGVAQERPRLDGLAGGGRACADGKTCHMNPLLLHTHAVN
jgi:hypothetical protein